MTRRQTTEGGAHPKRARVRGSARLGAWLGALGALGALLWAPPAEAQPDPGELKADFKGALQLLVVAGGAPRTAEARAASEIFPDARKTWMQVQGVDPMVIEGARRGAREWVCSQGCSLSDAKAIGTETEAPQSGQVEPGDAMLVSIKAQTPTLPLPITIWRPIAVQGKGAPNTPSRASSQGRLLFDPGLLGRRPYSHVCSYPPVDQPVAPGTVLKLPCVRDEPQGMPPTPDMVELSLGLQWPVASELADFQYVAVVDSCGNARVQTFQRFFTVPVIEVGSGGCGLPDGKALRVFPSGTSFRVTAFNLDHPATGDVVSATFRVSIPALEDLVSADNPPMLFPDPLATDLQIDCGPPTLKALPGPGGIPPMPPGAIPPGAKLPGAAPPGAAPPAGPPSAPPGAPKPPGATQPPPAPEEPPDGGTPDEPPIDDEGGGPEPPRGKLAEPIKPVPIQGPRLMPESRPTGQPLAHQGLVIAPEPLLRGDCRIELLGQTKRRLVAPLALHVSIWRTDKPNDSPIWQSRWTVTPNDATLHIPQLIIDGESRLRIEVSSDPLSADGNIVLLADAGRMARLHGTVRPSDLRRLIGSVTVYTAPLCGEMNFETVEGAGNCVRGYFTVPAMLATLQITRAPWVERPLITRKILGAVGLAFAIDSYDPVERQAFPIAFQVGGFIQDLDQDRLGILAYAGVAPTVPILGEGGNTTSIGLLAGAGIEYITNTNGPDEGFKPAAFVSIVVQVGQANPAVSGEHATFGQVNEGAMGMEVRGTGEYRATGYAGGDADAEVSYDSPGVRRGESDD
ncbi:MAG: hypothetical protein HY908_33440 [Myxococcales bacterium]|nr:hypothetical protein [Myxococcales bacterium]